MPSNNRRFSFQGLLIIAAVVAVIALTAGALETLYYMKKAAEASPSINHGDG